MLKERENYYIKLIEESESLIEVCRKAKIVPTTGNYDTLKKIIEKNKIDISHFKRLGGTPNSSRKETSYYLTSGSTITSYKLKNRLLKEGYKERRCEECKKTQWRGKPIPLELHHINGDNRDNRIENLQMLCPNCHAQTGTYGGKNQKLNKIKQKHKCEKKRRLTLQDEKEIVNASLNCESIKEIKEQTKHTERTIKNILSKYNITVNKTDEIKKQNDKKIPLILESLKATKSYTATGKEFGVSDNAIKKILVRRGYPSNIKDILSFLTSQ